MAKISADSERAITAGHVHLLGDVSERGPSVAGCGRVILLTANGRKGNTCAEPPGSREAGGRPPGPRGGGRGRGAPTEAGSSPRGGEGRASGREGTAGRFRTCVGRPPVRGGGGRTPGRGGAGAARDEGPRPRSGALPRGPAGFRRRGADGARAADGAARAFCVNPAGQGAPSARHRARGGAGRSRARPSPPSRAPAGSRGFSECSTRPGSTEPCARGEPPPGRRSSGGTGAPGAPGARSAGERPADRAGGGPQARLGATRPASSDGRRRPRARPRCAASSTRSRAWSPAWPWAAT